MPDLDLTFGDSHSAGDASGQQRLRDRVPAQAAVRHGRRLLLRLRCCDVAAVAVRALRSTGPSAAKFAQVGEIRGG